MLHLIQYGKVRESSYGEYMDEWEKSEEAIIPSAVKRDNRNFAELQKRWAEDQTDAMYEKGFVPSTLYFLINDEEYIFGAIHLRHELNERLLHNGGHIGYGVRPSQRRRGYASLMLNRLLQILTDKGYEKVLITCDDSNLPSSATIEKCGGCLSGKPFFQGELTRQYWIDLKN